MKAFFNIGPFVFDLNTIMSFVFGVVVGFTILLLLYLYAVIKSLNKGLRLRKTDEQDIDEEEIKWLIEDAKTQFKDKGERNQLGYYKYLMLICRELSVDIAQKFYPSSKYPYLELTIDETLHLSHYITNRINELLSRKILKLTKGFTLIKIVEMNETKERIEESKLYQTAKKYKVNEVLKTTVGVLNAVNPFYWGRKFLVNFAANTIIEKIGLAIIAITGEETYKIYSKKVFNEEKTIDAGVDSIYNEIKSDIPDEDEIHEKKKGRNTSKY